METRLEIPETVDRRQRWRRWLIVAVIVSVIPFGLASRWMHIRVTERDRVLAAIEAAGGKHYAPSRNLHYVRTIGRLFGLKDRNIDYDVLLDGPKFDDAWLAEHDDLCAIPVDELVARDTRLTREAALRLLDRHQLFCFMFPGVPFTDADCARIGEEERLIELSLMQSNITDAGLPALNPTRLRVLNVAGTHVTSAALQQELSGSQLMFLHVDGRQFTPELAAQLAQSPTLIGLNLIGPDVTDAHLTLLATMSNVKLFTIDQTSASPAAIDKLKAALPGANFQVVDATNAVIRWRNDQAAAQDEAHE